MGEYMRYVAGKTSHTGFIEYELINSFKTAVKEALPKVKSGKNRLLVNGWELGIDGDTGVIYHALMK